MRTLTAIVLTFCLGVSIVAASPEPTPKAFSQTYEEELNKANLRLGEYLKTDCNASEFVAIETRLHEEYNVFHTLALNIPESEDTWSQIRETEEFLGFRELVSNILVEKKKCEASPVTDLKGAALL